MNESELLAIVAAEEKKALGWGDGELSFEREQALKYYKGEPYGNEVEGRSEIVTTEVQDTVEWILPSLLKIFTASDKAVEFEPEGPEDEEKAKQATDTCNYVFYRQNPGFVVLYSFFKDALIQKNGYVKVYYEKTETKKKEQYQGLVDGQLQMLSQNPDVEIIEHTAYPDPMSNYGMAEPGMLHDVVLNVTRKDGKVCIKPVPPEEILVSSNHAAVDPQEATFFAHRQKLTISQLKEMGFDTKELESAGYDDNHLEGSAENQARHDLNEEQSYRDVDSLDPSMREVWVTEAYIRVDFDGDGIAELRKVMKTGKVVLENEEAEVIPFACTTPIINTHRHSGISVAELVMDLQLIKSMLTRQVLDNIYLTNAPRMAVIDGQANLDDLLTVRPGGVIRTKGPNAVTPITIPFMAQHGLAAMEYFDTVRAKRTGVTEQFAGVDADALNQTARGASLMQNNAMQRIELIARIFAETGVKPMFKLILHCLTKYHQKAMTIKLLNKFIDVDPREWFTSMDMTVNVGLGTGDKDQQLIHLQSVAMAQAEAIKMGGLDKIVTLKNIYNAQAKIVENAGFKNVEDFWADPESPEQMQKPKEPPPPDPEMIKVQGQMQLEDKKAQASFATEQQKLQMASQQSQIQAQNEQAKAQAQFQIEQMKIESNKEIELIKLQAQMELERFKAELVENTKLQTAQLSSQTELKQAAIAASTDEVEVGDDGSRKPAAGINALVEAMTNSSTQMVESLREMSGSHSAANEKLLTTLTKELSKPKKIIRGPDGKVTGAQ